MASHRRRLPQLGDDLFLTDGGIETTLIFLEGLELPDFAAFDLLRLPDGEAALRKYFRGYAALAQRFQTGLILESATWRASADWGRRLGYDTRALAAANRRAIEILDDIRGELQPHPRPVVVSGCIGPRGDGYSPTQTMSEKEAQAYHSAQVETFGDTRADMVTAITMNYAEEAIGITRAAERAGMPVAISFTVETDGRLPTGQTLRAAVERVDASTSGYPAYYMLNCAHPSHFEPVLREDEAWVRRLRGVRANASRKSHVELNEATELDIGDPAELAAAHARLKQRLPHLMVMGGCCGTDVRHVEQIAMACAPSRRTAGD